MKTLNRFGDTLHELTFHDGREARQFCKMLGRNPRCFSLVGLRHEGGRWTLRYRARKDSPWSPDPRAAWLAATN